jgi:hypothetical protein
MTVRTDDIALRDLVQYACRTSSADHPGHFGALLPGVTMIEVQCARQESAAAVGARGIAVSVE